MKHTLRRLESIEDYKACERLQQRAWGFADGIDVVPQTQLVTAQKWGGLVLGAFAPGGELEGFCYGFLGRSRDGEVVLCSHMLAVDERARSSGLGARLKWAQRDHALAQGIRTVVWTYDPLESVNACLNFDKLGCLSDLYWINLYGETTSRLHAGTATDRLNVRWRVASPRVARRAAGERGKVATTLREGRLEVSWALRADGAGPGEPILDLDADRLACEIPVSIQGLKERDRGAAVAWREASRAVFTGYFGRGYFARECVHQSAETAGRDGGRTVYLFERGELEVCAEDEAVTQDSPPRRAGQKARE